MSTFGTKKERHPCIWRLATGRLTSYGPLSNTMQISTLKMILVGIRCILHHKVGTSVSYDYLSTLALPSIFGTRFKRHRWPWRRARGKLKSGASLSSEGLTSTPGTITAQFHYTSPHNTDMLTSHGCC